MRPIFRAGFGCLLFIVILAAASVAISVFVTLAAATIAVVALVLLGRWMIDLVG